MKSLWLGTVAVLLGLGAGAWMQEEKKNEPKQESKKDSGKKVDDTKIAWVGLKEGLKKAKEENKPVMIDFHIYTKNKKTGKYICGRCETMDKETYVDKELIKKVNENFIPVLVDLTRMTPEEKKLGKRFKYEVNGQPDCILIFLTPDDKVLLDEGGKPLSSPSAAKLDEVNKMIEEALKGKTGK